MRSTAAASTASAFVPSYGMAEVGLAISFAQRERGVGVDHVDRNDCVKHRHARPVSKLNRKSAPVRAFVDCGAPLPGIQVEVRDADGNLSAGARDRHVVGANRQRDAGLSASAGSHRRSADARRLARHRRPRLSARRSHLRHRPREGHDHRRRAQLLAAGSGIRRRIAGVGAHRRLDGVLDLRRHPASASCC